MPDGLNAKRIFLTDGQILSDFVISKLRFTPTASSIMPKVLAIGGYPFMGKSVLAKKIAASWGDNSYVLPTESVVFSRRQRLSIGLDGSSVSAHRVEALSGIIDAIVAGSSVGIDQYSWKLGRHEGSEASPILGRGGLLVVDGSVSTSAALVHKCDVAVQLYPADFERWLNLAVDRDVLDRNWNRTEAFRQNWLKARTVDAQLKNIDHAEWILPVELMMEEERGWAAEVRA